MAGNDAYTKLLLHCDGADGSTSFLDDSPSAHTVTPYGNTHVSTATSKFGGASAYFDGDGDWLQIPDSVDFDFGIGSWTIDFWVYPQDGTYYGGFPSVTTYNDSGWVVGFSDTSFKIMAMIDYNIVLTAATPCALYAWTHVAVVKDASDNSLRIFLNGTKDAETTDTNSWDGRPGDDAYIGRFYSTYDNFYFQGCLDELRISKGVARWTSDFTPPDAPYGVDPMVFGHRIASPINRIPPHAVVW